MKEAIARKNTDDLLKELESSEDFVRYYSDNRDQFVDRSLPDALSSLLKEKGMTKPEVIQKAELNENTGFQIFSGIRRPSREKLLSIALAMKLSFPETRLLLRTAGLAPLYVKDEFDCVVAYGILHQESVMQVNERLFDCLGKTLGDEK